MRSFIGAVTAVVLLSSGAAMAKEGYGAAGCGLGAVLIGDQPGFVQVFAATLNGCFASQTFGITTGTLNCGAAATEELSQRTKVYVEANREVLAKDISRGQGETIADLAAMAGCGNSEAVGATLQSNFQVIFPSADASSEHVTQSLLETLKANPTLACGSLS